MIVQLFSCYKKKNLKHDNKIWINFTEFFESFTFFAQFSEQGIRTAKFWWGHAVCIILQHLIFLYVYAIIKHKNSVFAAYPFTDPNTTLQQNFYVNIDVHNLPLILN